MAKTKALGRGLDALLGHEEQRPATGSMTVLAIANLQPGEYQPRSRMDQGALEELAESIRQQGILQPILVRPVEAGRHEIIAGERRWRAAQLAGLLDVPVLIKEIPNESALAVALIENIQREDLNPLEEAMGLVRLIDEFGMTHDAAAQAVGRSRSAVSNLIRLLQLSESVRSLLFEGMLEMGHARALLPLPEAQQRSMALNVVDHQWSVRETERRVARLQKEKVSKQNDKSQSRDVLRIEEALSETLGSPVKIQEGRGGRGTLEIRYHSLEELQGLLERLGFREAG